MGSLLSEATGARSGDFLIGGGIMGELIRAKDWSSTPLGAIETWPQSLRTTVSICLASNFPINLIWGPQHVQIYNDGYRPVCAGKHPQSLGEDYTKTWASAWDILDRVFQRALAGETSFIENERMFLDRNGYLEETFFTFSLSPIRDEAGAVGGLFHPVTETTEQMLSQRRTRALRDLAGRGSEAKSVREACELAAEALGKYQLDIPFALIYRVDDEGKEARLSARAHMAAGLKASPEAIDLRDGAGGGWPLRAALLSGTAGTVAGLSERFGPIECGPYEEGPEMALVLPMGMGGGDRAGAFLIAAASPRLPFNEAYRDFLEMTAATLGAAMASARAYEEESARAEKLAELDAAKTLFFNNVSHEFRTPLTLMLGPMEELLAGSGEECTAKRETLELLNRNGLRLLRLVNTLLDFSRIEAGRAQANYEATDLAALTADLASSFRSLMEKAGLELRVKCGQGVEVYVDRGMWEQIVLNLLSNAFKFTFSGSIEVGVEDKGDEVEVAVRDTGTGIPAEELPQLFERFHRVKGARGRTYEGTGIGLALVENLVKLHGGTIRVESQVGAGTSFYVRLRKGWRHLPAGRVGSEAKEEAGARNSRIFLEEAARWLPANGAQGNEAGEGAGAEAREGRTKRVLLADDNADMREYIQRILERDFAIEAVGNGAEALRAARERTPDLVLTDVMMPELDGFGLLKELRSDRRTRGIPVIMLSARAGEESRVEGLEAGADDYLVKPFSGRELQARVKVNLELAQLRGEVASETERLRGAEEMERQWRLFDTALSHTPDFLCVFDAAQRLLYMNRALLERRQRPLEDMLGKTVAELGFSAGVAARIQQQLEQVTQRGEALRDKISFADDKGRERHFDYVLVPVMGKDGGVEAVAGSAREITEFVETNRELREANADLEQFAYSASHDLQAPLRVIDNISKWLEEDLHEHLNAQTRQYIGLLRSRVKRMEKLLDDLLEYARIGRTPGRGSGEMVLGAELVNDVLAMLPHEGFTVEASPAFAAIQAPRMPLQQILMNLIGNAVKHHHGKSGRIEVTAEDGGAYYVIAVKDDGPGIAPEFHEQIFKMFQTLKPKDQVEGSGMGLALVRKFVEVSGGTIGVESAVGKGSTFRFTWPKKPRQEN